MPITAQYDEEADALYIRLSDLDRVRVRALEIDNETYIDVDAEGRPVGIEILYPSMGLNLQAILKRFGLESRLAEVLAAVSGTSAALGSVTMTGGQYLASTTMVLTAVEGTIAAATAGVVPGFTTSQTTGQLIQSGC
jgi:uncharacterized protein YuzE